MRLEIHKAKRGWHWRFRATNGRIIALGGEPFATKANALRAFKTLKRRMAVFGFYGIVRLSP